MIVLRGKSETGSSIVWMMSSRVMVVMALGCRRRGRRAPVRIGVIHQTDLGEIPPSPEGRRSIYCPFAHRRCVEADFRQGERMAQRAERIVLLHHRCDELAIAGRLAAVAAVMREIIAQFGAVFGERPEPPLIETQRQRVYRLEDTVLQVGQ